MTYYVLKVKTINGMRIVKIPEKEMHKFLDIAKGFDWKLEFIA